MAEKIDFESAIFGTSEAPWPWPWIGSYGILSCITHRPHVHTKFHWNRTNFLWTDVQTDGRTYLLTDGHFPSNVIRSIKSSQPKKCNFRQFSELQKPVTLTLDWVKVISACTIPVGLPTCPTVWLYSSIMEIWPFEICVILTFHEVWTHVITFLEGNWKIGLWPAVD